jgi:hypothetical protein
MLAKSNQPVGWLALAACRGQTELFFAEDRSSQRLACAICQSCPVRRLCEVDVRSWERPYSRHGVVAGLTPKQRRENWGACC